MALAPAEEGHDYQQTGNIQGSLPPRRLKAHLRSISQGALRSLRCLAVRIEVSGSFSNVANGFVLSKISIGLGVGGGRGESLKPQKGHPKGEGWLDHTKRSFKLIEVKWQLCSPPGNLLRLSISK